MPTVFVFRIRQLTPTGEDLYVPFCETTPLTVRSGPVAATCLQQIAAEADGFELLCEPALEEAGATAGFQVPDSMDWYDVTRIRVILKIAQDPDLDAIKSNWAIDHYLTCATDFIDSAVAAGWPEDIPIRFSLAGTYPLEGELMILRDASTLCVLAFERSGAVEALVQGSDLDAVLANHHYSRMVFEVPPPFAAAPLMEVFEADQMPRLTRFHERRSVTVEDSHLYQMASILEALCELETLDASSTSTINTPECVLTATLNA